MCLPMKIPMNSPMKISMDMWSNDFVPSLYGCITITISITPSPILSYSILSHNLLHTLDTILM